MTKYFNGSNMRDQSDNPSHHEQMLYHRATPCSSQGYESFVTTLKQELVLCSKKKQATLYFHSGFCYHQGLLETYHLKGRIKSNFQRKKEPHYLFLFWFPLKTRNLQMIRPKSTTSAQLSIALLAFLIKQNKKLQRSDFGITMKNLFLNSLDFLFPCSSKSFLHYKRVLL